MSLNSNLQDLATRIATENKSLRTLLNGNVADLSGLDTTDKTNLVNAINEVLAATGGGPISLDDLTDVIITTPSTGHIIRHNGTNWVNALGTTFFEVAGAAAAAQAASQPLDSDLTSIAALTTTTYGRAFLELANQAALVALLPGYQPLDSDLTSIAALTTTSYGRAFLELANQAALVALLPSYQPLDTDLTAIAALTSAANKGLQSTGAGTWALYDLTAAGKALLDDADAAAQRTTLDVWSKTEIGSVTTDFVAVFEAGLV